MTQDTKEKDFNYFLECLYKATSNIEDHYFNTKVYGSKVQIFRERVYCYELYHQLRKLLDDEFPYKLNGELDKQNHPGFHENIVGKKPDFLVHIPGEMKNNLVVIEVKSINNPNRDIREDLIKLNLFLENAEYFRAILLIYGKGNANIIYRIKEECELNPKSKIIFIWQKEPMKPAKIINLKGCIP
jgi:hypothetical protein